MVIHVPANNGDNSSTATVRLALLEQSANQNKDDIEVCQRKIAKVDDSLEAVKDVQNESLVVLQKMETNLEHLNEKLEKGDKAREQLASNQITMSQAFTKTDTKFRVIVGILSALGLALLPLIVKLLFFFPSGS
jgi:uncharacterized protein YoxC